MRKRTLHAWVLILSLGISVITRADLSNPKPVKVFILAGQSNMVGDGHVEPAETQGTLAYMHSVTCVETRDFFRTPEQSPTGASYHWNSNAETYFLIGHAMAQAMKNLMGQPIDAHNSSRDEAAETLRVLSTTNMSHPWAARFSRTVCLARAVSMIPTTWPCSVW